MKQTLLIILGTTILFISTSFLHENESNTGVLGDIKYSILPPDEFKELNGESWRLINGDNISDTDLFDFLNDRNLESILWLNDDSINVRIPDLRNKFIRNMGDKDRIVGSKQSYSTAAPVKPIKIISESKGTHQHKFYRGGYKGNNDMYFASDARKAKSGTGSPVFTHKTDMEGNHDHPVKIVAGWDKETRPSNIAFYTYIKVEK